MGEKPMTDPMELVGLVEQRIGQDFDGECHLTETEARQIAACIREMVEWRPIETAPRDGTVIIAMARYTDATAGFPAFIHFMDGEWRQIGRTVMPPMICWAWKSRNVLGGWPSEYLPPSPGAEA